MSIGISKRDVAADDGGGSGEGDGVGKTEIYSRTDEPWELPLLCHRSSRGFGGGGGTDGGGGENESPCEREDPGFLYEQETMRSIDGEIKLWGLLLRCEEENGECRELGER